jgi:hypothetical protein
MLPLSDGIFSLMRYIMSTLLLSVVLGVTPASVYGVVETEDQGTNVKGESGNFESFINDVDTDREGLSIEFMRFDPDTRVAFEAGDRDPNLGLKMNY